MTWVRLDDGVYAHHKLLAVPRATRWVWVAGLAWSSQQRRDGQIARGALSALQGTPRDAAALVAAGLWVPDGPGGWRIHDYADFQPVNGALSTKRAEAGRRGAAARWDRQAT